MIQKHRFKKFVKLGAQLLLIVTLWFGGVYAFQAINSLNIAPSIATSLHADGNIDIWWPAQNANVSDTQTFKVLYKDKSLSDYTMTWSVDDGQANPMYDSSTDYPHKEAVVDLRSWTWRGGGPYKITFKATDTQGKVLGESSVMINLPGAQQGPVSVVAPSQNNQIIGSVAGVTSVAAQTQSSKTINVWTPTPNATVNGLTPFKATIEGMNPDQYQMFWQVDKGQQNEMYDSYADAAHKEASVDLSSWNWNAEGKYLITFTAKQGGVVLATVDVQINKGGIASTPKQQTQQTQPVQNQQKVAPLSMNAEVAPALAAPVKQSLSSSGFYVNPNSNAKRQADAWRSSRPQDAYQMDKIASSPEAIWLGGWNGNVESDVRNKMTDAKAQGTMPVFIAYNVPNRDCGSHSAGGVSDAGSYKSWIQKIASGINGGRAIVVLEPDGLSLIDCLNQQQKNERFAMISDAVAILKGAGATVYIDAGHPDWIEAQDMAFRLINAGIGKADGFALNVSNFYTTESNIVYGTALSQKLSGKHFIIDTARNGVGPTPDKQWCNPQGRALGQRATTDTGNPLVDAYLWLKNPGESDGNCNGGPSAGTWWPEYALDLAKRSAF